MKCLQVFAVALGIVAGCASIATAQERQGSNRRAFEPTYIDAAARRGDRPLLYDWPALLDLVTWTHAAGASFADTTGPGLGEEIVAEFRVRLDTLRATALPPFVEPHAEAVTVALDSISVRLDRVAGVVAGGSREVLPGDAAVLNDAGRDRTLVTGETAVTVPAGIAVGAPDSLPIAIFGEIPMVGIGAWDDSVQAIDDLVHLIREAASGPPDERSPTPPPGTAPRPPER